jgi:hypothetical protein
MKKLMSFVLSFTILLVATMPVAPKSEAIVGIIIKSRQARVIGGLSAGGGTLFSVIIYNAALASGATGWAALQVGISAAVYVSLGLTVGFLGLVVLDDKTVADFKFLPLEIQTGEHQEALEIYNSELDQLNAIKERIEADLEANESLDAKTLWDDYGSSLSPETLMVAKAIADGFVKQAQPIN